MANAIIGLINLTNCFHCDIALVTLIRNRQKIEPIKMIPWTSTATPKIQNPNINTIPVSTSVLTLMKFLLVVINTISVEIFGAKPDLNIVYFPITLMLDMPLILILTVSLITIANYMLNPRSGSHTIHNFLIR